MMRAALVSLIDLEPDLEVVGQAGRGDEVEEQVLALRPDVALLDLDMPGRTGFQVASRMADVLPHCATLILTAIPKPGALQRAMRARAPRLRRQTRSPRGSRRRHPGRRPGRACRGLFTRCGCA